MSSWTSRPWIRGNLEVRLAADLPLTRWSYPAWLPRQPRTVDARPGRPNHSIIDMLNVEAHLAVLKDLVLRRCGASALGQRYGAEGHAWSNIGEIQVLAKDGRRLPRRAVAWGDRVDTRLRLRCRRRQYRRLAWVITRSKDIGHGRAVPHGPQADRDRPVPGHDGLLSISDWL